MNAFSKAYVSLNPAQKAAVDHVEGAVLVIAGPGTGKTQLLSLRVANILDKTDTSPQNILCLTFTNKAANNMQLRLSRLVGSAGQRVMIKTFHSFAAELMAQYPQYFWNGATLVNVPDAVQLEIITDILSNLPLNNPLALKFAGQYTAVNDVKHALKLSKEAGLTPEKLRTLIDHNLNFINEIEPELVAICADRLSYKNLDELAMKIESLPQQHTDALTRPLASLSTVLIDSFETAHTLDDGTSKTKNTSAWKSRWIQSIVQVKGMHKERERNEWWLNLANVYKLYRDTLHERGYYDYADMIIEVITQIEQNPSMRADVQEQFQYVLIDEFQDTNAAQLRLAHIVADSEVAEGNPNIMAVGDDDQSIYKFNGAELSNMRDFLKSYKQAGHYILSDNYRSHQAVLDFSTTLIKQASERAVTGDGVSKQLIAHNNVSAGSIEHIAYPTREHQYYGIAQHIAEIKKSPGSVVVLARSHESLRAVAHALHQLKVPVRYEQQQSILELPMIVEITHIARIVNALSHGDPYTANQYIPLLLSNPSWRVLPESLWQLALLNRSEPEWIESLLRSKDSNLETIGHWLLWLSGEAKNMPLPRMLELFIGLRASEHLTSPLRRYYLESKAIDTPYIASISAIQKLIGLSQEFCEHGQSKLEDFIRLIEISKDNNATLTDESLFVTAEDAVELMTVHKAKGLEFDSVFIVDAMESIWRPSTQGRRPPANLPLRPSGDTIDDYIRLMFVAVTRAKQNITVTSYYTTATGEEAVPSAIIRDIMPAHRIDFTQAGDPIPVLESAITWPRLEGSNEMELLRNVLENYTLTPSGLIDFLDVNKGGPRYFLQKHLLRIPEAQTTAAAFGNAIHKCLESAQQFVTEQDFDVSYVLNSFEGALKKQLISQSEYERYAEHGQQVLQRLFNEYELILDPSGRPEVSLRVIVNNVPLYGKLDRVDYDELQNIALITDYKTGKPLNTFTTRDKNLALKAWRYKTQLGLYTAMLRESGTYKNLHAITTQILFVEAEIKKDMIRTYVPSDDELKRIERLLPIVYKKITQLTLPDVSNYKEGVEGIVQFENDLLDGMI